MRPSLISRGSAILLILFLHSPVPANIGPKWWGDRAAEPLGLKNLGITHEELTIDLRPLADVQPVKVEAIYYLNNAGPARTIELFFLTGISGVRDFMVRLDDRLLESRELPRKKWPGTEYELPLNWQPPADMPGIDSDKSRSHIYRRPGEQVVLAFSVDLPPGRSILSTRYSAKAYGEDEEYPTVTWQFPYILAPAREWGSFGELDVTVHLPETWQAASTLALERDGGVLRGRFTRLPADCLALAVRAPVGPELERSYRQAASLYIFTVMSGGLLCWWIGRLQGRFLARKTIAGDRLWGFCYYRIAPFAFLLAAGWLTMVVAVMGLARDNIFSTLSGQESPYFHERLFLPSCGSLASLPLIFLAGFWLTWGGSRRSLQLAVRRQAAKESETMSSASS